MNYYKLSNFHSITISELVKRFHSNETIRIGAISIFGDSVGKPGDTIYSIKKISKMIDLKGVIIDFGSLKINVFGTDSIVINKKIIGISNCSKIEWIENDLQLEYKLQGEKLNTKTVNGNHIFKSNSNKDALIIYTW